MINYQTSPAKDKIRYRWKNFLSRYLIGMGKIKDVLCLPGEEALEIPLYDQLRIPRSDIYGVEKEKRIYEKIKEKKLGINLYHGELKNFLNDISVIKKRFKETVERKAMSKHKPFSVIAKNSFSLDFDLWFTSYLQPELNLTDQAGFLYGPKPSRLIQQFPIMNIDLTGMFGTTLTSEAIETLSHLSNKGCLALTSFAKRDPDYIRLSSMLMIMLRVMVGYNLFDMAVKFLLREYEYYSQNQDMAINMLLREMLFICALIYSRACQKPLSRYSTEGTKFNIEPMKYLQLAIINLAGLNDLKRLINSSIIFQKEKLSEWTKYLIHYLDYVNNTDWVVSKTQEHNATFFNLGPTAEYNMPKTLMDAFSLTETARSLDALKDPQTTSMPTKIERYAYISQKGSLMQTWFIKCEDSPEQFNFLELVCNTLLNFMDSRLQYYDNQGRLKGGYKDEKYNKLFKTIRSYYQEYRKDTSNRKKTQKH